MSAGFLPTYLTSNFNFRYSLHIALLKVLYLWKNYPNLARGIIVYSKAVFQTNHEMDYFCSFLHIICAQGNNNDNKLDLGTLGTTKTDFLIVQIHFCSLNEKKPSHKCIFKVLITV